MQRRSASLAGTHSRRMKRRLNLHCSAQRTVLSPARKEQGMHVISPQRRLTPREAVEVLLESFVRQLRYLPSGAHPLAVLEELPRRLQLRARSLRPQVSWRAWTDGVRFWFIAARLCKSVRAPANVLALQILFFDPDGQPVAAGEWTFDANGRWTLRHLMDPVEVVGMHSALARQRFH
jgi:hypothetical protein